MGRDPTSEVLFFRGGNAVFQRRLVLGTSLNATIHGRGEAKGACRKLDSVGFQHISEMLIMLLLDRSYGMLLGRFIKP
jgi:hypothetical protein